MKKAIVSDLHAVGMHNWHGRQLEIGAVYYCRPGKNVHDHNAIAIYQDKHYIRKVAYLKRENAKTLKELFDKAFISKLCYLRAKTAHEKFRRSKGPMQNVSIGFIASSNNIDAKKSLCSAHNLNHKIFKIRYLQIKHKNIVCLNVCCVMML